MKGFFWIVIALILILSILNKTPDYKLVSDVQDDSHKSIISKEEQLYLFLTDQ